VAGAMVVAAVAILVHANSLSNEYVLDDVPAVVENPAAHWPPDVGRIFTSNYWGNRPNYEKLTIYRPLATLSFALVDGFAPDGPEVQRAVNLLVHAGCAVLVFLLVLTLGQVRGQMRSSVCGQEPGQATGRDLKQNHGEVQRPATGGSASASPESVMERAAQVAPALLCGLLFAVHPVHTEAVIGVVSRAELLSAFFVLAGTLFYLRRLAGNRGEGRKAALDLAVLGGLFGLALLSKENGVTLWGILLALQLAEWVGSGGGLRRPGLRLVALHGIMGLLLGGYLLLRSAVLPAVLGGAVPYSDNPMVGGDLVVRWLTPFKVFLTYIGLLVSPTDLSIDYSLEHFKVVRSLADWPGWSGLILFFGMAAAALLVARRRPSLAGLLLAFFASYSVVSNLPFLSTIIMAERLIYLPSAFFLGAVAILAQSAARSGRGAGGILAAGAVVVFAVFCAGTLFRNLEWRTPMSLYEAAVRTAPDSAKSRHLLGLELARAGRSAEALEHLGRSVAINPDNFKARTNLARALAQTGRYDEALEHLKTVLTQAPGHRAALDVVCGIYQVTGKPPAAARVCR